MDGGKEIPGSSLGRSASLAYSSPLACSARSNGFRRRAIATD
jgi:hypothetical protein